MAQGKKGKLILQSLFTTGIFGAGATAIVTSTSGDNFGSATTANLVSGLPNPFSSITNPIDNALGLSPQKVGLQPIIILGAIGLGIFLLLRR